MLKQIAPSPLFRILECPDLMTDGCLCDERNNLVFASLWGRDTAVHEFIARLSLQKSEDGLDSFHVVMPNDSCVPVFVGNVDRLVKNTTRAYRRTLFGSMIHLFLFDRSCKEPDKANASAISILTKEASNRTERLWAMVQKTCPLPLMDHWRDVVLDLLQARAMLSPIPLVVGELQGYRLSIDVPALTEALGELICCGVLDESPSEPRSEVRLLRVA